MMRTMSIHALRFTALEEGKYRLRIQDANQQGGPAYVYRLTISADAPLDGVNRSELPDLAERAACRALNCICRRTR